jgi:hypothetical protein
VAAHAVNGFAQSSGATFVAQHQIAKVSLTKSIDGAGAIQSGFHAHLLKRDRSPSPATAAKYAAAVQRATTDSEVL